MRVCYGVMLLLVLTSCTADQPVMPGQGTIPGTLRTAPTAVVIADTRLTLWTSLWRDFQPVTPPDGQPLIAVLRVTTADSTVFPADVRADSTWILFGGQLWAAAVTEEQPRSVNAPSLEVVARGGPKWGPDVYVEVVIRLWDGRGQRFLLQAPHQYIGRTD